MVNNSILNITFRIIGRLFCKDDTNIQNCHHGQLRKKFIVGTNIQTYLAHFSQIMYVTLFFKSLALQVKDIVKDSALVFCCQES